MSESAVATEPHFEPAAEPQELSLGEIIRRAEAGETAEQITGEAQPAAEGAARDANGRFTAKNADGETAEEVSTDQPAPTAEEPETPAIPPPQAWSGPEKEVFATLPREAQEAILRRERDVERSFQERAKPLKDYEAIQEVLAPFAANYRVQGYTDVDAVRMWATVATELRRDPANAIRQLIQSHNLSPEQIFGRPVDSQQHTAGPVDSALAREVADLKRLVAERDQREQQTEQQRILGRIDAFAKDPANKYFEDVRLEMGALMQVRPDMTMEEAYKRAIRANDDVWAKVQAEESAAKAAKQQVEAKAKAEAARRAGVSVRGAPPVGSGGAAHGNRTLRQEIEAAMAAQN